MLKIPSRSYAPEPIETECKRFSGQVTLTPTPLLMDECGAVVSVSIVDRLQIEEWGSYIRLSRELEPTLELLRKVEHLLLESIFRSMELSWTEGLTRFLPTARAMI